jgi:hypothetical protein
MIFEKNAKTGELAFSKNFLLMLSVAVFDDLERVMSSEVFFKWQRRIFTIVLNRSFNCLPGIATKARRKKSAQQKSVRHKSATT